MPAKREVYRIKDVQSNGTVGLQGKCGATLVNTVIYCAPYHLPAAIVPSIDVSLRKPELSYACEICRFTDEESTMRLCDACGTGWHMACLTPPLNKVPNGDYVCPRCPRDGVTVQDIAEERKRQKALQETNPAPLQPAAPL